MDSLDDYSTRIEELRKISRYCYISYKGNCYSVPWVYAGRISGIVPSSTLKIQVDSQIVAENISQDHGEYQGIRSILKAFSR